MLKRIHHIDFLVRDMEQAIAQYTRIFGVEIENRVKVQGVDLAYFHIGDVLIALISPVDPRSPLSKQLDERGEGLMHMGCEVESLEAAVRDLAASARPAPQPGSDTGPSQPSGPAPTVGEETKPGWLRSLHLWGVLAAVVAATAAASALWLYA